nr:class I SAM-dependent methyltransferase [Streptomyces sp. AC555_RSS877]
MTGTGGGGTSSGVTAAETEEASADTAAARDGGAGSGAGHARPGMAAVRAERAGLGVAAARAEGTGRNLLTDNPALYEARFPDPGRLAGRWAEDCLDRHGAGGRVLDMGCGVGRDAARLHEAGRSVTGADVSEAMLEYARVHHPGPRYVRADLHGFDFGASVSDAVVCLDSSLLYCHTNAQLDGFLASCRRALAPGGLIVAEMRNGAYFLGRTDLLDTPTVSGFEWQGVSYRSTTHVFVDRTAQLLRRKRVWTSDDAAAPVEQHSAWRLVFPLELRHFLGTHGFEVLELHDGPGPRTEPAWREGRLPGATTDGDRLHLVARRLNTTH